MRGFFPSLSESPAEPWTELLFLLQSPQASIVPFPRQKLWRPSLAGETAFSLAMRLLNTSSLTLEYFPSVIPKYAILSHRWEEEEVLYDDIQNGASDKVKVLKGYSKVQRSCTLARQEGYNYIWIDTCCIDKASSAELSESINSMFMWYQKAAICYAYLSDISTGTSESDSNNAGNTSTPFTSSQWFTRGWTLQELIAPSRVAFYNTLWEPIGTKSELCDKIQEWTGIPSTVLVCEEPRIADYEGLSLLRVLRGCSVAQRMSWAARRHTTRVEDVAYSLLGIFGVNMPLLYGEGMRAFVRLQEEIIKTTDDQSILAFARNGPEWPLEGQNSLLAESPHCFADKANISLVAWAETFPMTPSSKSINIEMMVCPLEGPYPDGRRLSLGILACADATVHHDPIHPAIVLQAVNQENSIFQRVCSDLIFQVGFGSGDVPLSISLDKRWLRRLYCFDLQKATQMNLQLLMTKRPWVEVPESRDSHCRWLTIPSLSGGFQLRFSFPPRPDKTRNRDNHPKLLGGGRTYSMNPKYRYQGYAGHDLCGIIALDLTHAVPSTRLETFWIFYGGFQLSLTGGWCKIVSTRSMLKVSIRHGLLSRGCSGLRANAEMVKEGVERNDEMMKEEVDRYIWGSSDACKLIAGLSEDYGPGKASEERSVIPGCSVTACVEERSFLGYNYLALSLDVKNGPVPDSEI
ncbi:heterokaryon incompatibility protein-domain-containing protein [Podospora conica]|nr:heterokaryon incompatibility protein-domain-containing protein [Schizothecium conicum]